jgi:protein gp37
MSDFWHEDVPLPWLDEALDVIDRTPKLTYQILTKRPGNVQRRLDALKRRLPANIWIGATIGHERSLPLLKPLRAVDATLRFLSCEPLLTALPGLSLDGIGWLISGGQSGRDAAPTHPDWVRALRDLCVAAGVPFHFKQWGEYRPQPDYFGVDLLRFPHGAPDYPMRRVGKKTAGAMLDGREWREFPTINHGDPR